MGTVNINGKVYSGNNISIINGIVKIDGVRKDGVESGDVKVNITGGMIQSLTTDASVECVSVIGDVTAGGSVRRS